MKKNNYQVTKWAHNHNILERTLLVIWIVCALIVSIVKGCMSNWIFTVLGSIFATFGTYLEIKTSRERNPLIAELGECDIATSAGVIMLLAAVYLN